MLGWSITDFMKKILLVCLLCMPFSIVKGGEPNKGYRGYLDFALGDAYNFNTAQKVSTNNMQLYSMLSTTHGYALKNWFVGGGVGYYHSFRDKENMYPVYAAGRYTFRSAKLSPYIESRGGIVYDPHWVHKVQAYGTLGIGMNVYHRIQAGLMLSMFSRPSRYFTANAAVVVSYEFGKK